MAKIITVESCADCPHQSWLGDAYPMTMFCSRAQSAIGAVYGQAQNVAIPNWCPLQDAPDIEALQAVVEAARAVIAECNDTWESLGGIEKLMSVDSWYRLLATLEALG